MMDGGDQSKGFTSFLKNKKQIMRKKEQMKQEANKVLKETSCRTIT
jgi:hypothetical protein